MFLRCRRLSLLLFVSLVATVPLQLKAQSSSPSKQVRKPVSGTDSGLDAGTISGGAYRNQALGLSCKIPAGWVLRTEEMNAGDEDLDWQAKGENPPEGEAPQQPPRARRDAKDNQGSSPTGRRVLLAAFSRPPGAAGEDVNLSILIAAESVAAYPGLKEAVQYLGPVSEVAKAQGFSVAEEPYEFLVGTKKLVREDFHRDVGSRVMRQSTLVLLARGYAVSVTFIAGTEEEVEELAEGLSVGGERTPTR